MVSEHKMNNNFQPWNILQNKENYHDDLHATTVIWRALETNQNLSSYQTTRMQPVPNKSFLVGLAGTSDLNVEQITQGGWTLPS